MKNFGNFVVPDICKNSSILTIIVFTQLIAICICLVPNKTEFLFRLGLVSIYLHWIVLLSTALLCLLKNRLNKKNSFKTVLGAIVCCYLPFLFIETASQYIDNKFSFSSFDVNRFFAFSIITLICTGIALRLFAVLALMEERNKSEMSLKMQALQSRIKPHFLFNSLNTISELIVTEPKHAEEAVGSLSMLFRASLENDNGFHKINNEVVLCKRYLELEHWRMGNRLSVDWKIEIKKPDDIQVPKLIIQPLIENAVLHGVQENGNVNIKVDIKESKQHISIMVENINGIPQKINSGNGIAIENIRERLFVLFDDQQTFRVRESSNTYRVYMRFAKKFINDIT